jgi:hypothetical protein
MEGTMSWLSAGIHAASLWSKDHLLPIAPLLTPTVAVIAGCIAYYSIHVQRKLVRSRAAIDFFLKTDLDKSMVDAHAAFEAAAEKLGEAKEGGIAIEEFCKTEEYKRIRAI